MLAADRDRLDRAARTAIDYLLSQRNAAGHWEGELSTSALSTATAVMALFQFTQHAASTEATRQAYACRPLIERGCAWLIAHQNADGGWGDTVKSFSNISTTMLCHATLAATRTLGADASYTTLSQNEIVTRDEAILFAARYIDRAGGVPALIQRYGKDKTFSVPILTHCALAGLVPWEQVPRLPFELACIPAKWYAAARFPVVSYALPALIAIGQVRHHHGPTWNPITRWLRWLARDRSLKVLEKIQPTNGGFLEAAPLTSFVCMSLASMGLTDHPVVCKGINFLIQSVRDDGSWPIDTNLATWVTTLAVNALEEDLPEADRPRTLKWLLDQQYKVTHPYTNAAPGGWAWTDQPGGVPDADDTPGAVLAIDSLVHDPHAPDVSRVYQTECHAPTEHAIRWLVDLQNRDGGFPTFCRGWGTLPFDRSSPDITAHCLRAMVRWRYRGLPDFLIENHFLCQDLRYEGVVDDSKEVIPTTFDREIDNAMDLAVIFLNRVQRPNGSWLPLWFGNQHIPDDENPVYGTSRVLRAYRECGLHKTEAAQRGYAWLLSVQNPDGGWGGDKGAPSSVEETALALDALLECRGGKSQVPSPNATGLSPAATNHLPTNHQGPRSKDSLKTGGQTSPHLPESPQPSTLNPQLLAGINYLIERVESGTWTEPLPIGFYFAKLWYFEKLYPVIWTVAALRKAVQVLSRNN